MTNLPPSSVAPTHFHTDGPHVQIGWLGHRDGQVYRLDHDPSTTERGGFTPIYRHWGETCGHQIPPEPRCGPPYLIVVQLADGASPETAADLLADARRALGPFPPGTQVTACQGSTADAALAALRSEP